MLFVGYPPHLQYAGTYGDKFFICFAILLMFINSQYSELKQKYINLNILLFIIFK